MKASELIKELEKVIEKKGDLNVRIYDAFNDDIFVEIITEKAYNSELKSFDNIGDYIALTDE